MTVHRTQGESDAADAKILEEVVEELNIPQLAIHHIGFRVGSRQTDVEARRPELGLEPAPVHFETANNLSSPARLNHLGVRVCWGDSPSATREWHHAAVLAAAWSCGAGADPEQRLR